MAEARSAPFEYERLEDAAAQVRLLRLLRSESMETEEIHCELTAWPIGQEPRYAAISYTWGAPGIETAIYINHKAFAVRSNCLYVLQQAHVNATTDYLWIDAICINQTDAVEKSAQVAMMGDIYRKAVRTNVVIGPHHDDSKYLINAISEHIQWAHRLVEDAYTLGKLQQGSPQLKAFEKRAIEQNKEHASSPQQLSQTLSIWPRWVSYELQLSSAFTNHPASQLTCLWKAIDALFRRPYFDRLWIIQEVVLSRTAVVLCGDSSINFDAIKEFESNLYRYCQDNQVWSREHIEYNRHETLETISDFARKYKDAGPTGFDLDELTDRTSNFKCSDPRDRIFGVLSLVAWQGRDPIQPDYAKSKLALALQTMEHIFGIVTNGEDSTHLADTYPGATETSATWPIVSATQLAIALGLTSSDSDIQALLTQRRNIKQPTEYTPQPNSDLRKDQKHRKEASKIPVPADYATRLYLSPKTNTLKSSLLRRGDSHLALNARQLELLQARDSAREVPITDSPFPIVKTGNRLCAKLPSCARPGDLILSFQRTSAFDVGLLVRHVGDEEERYRIIGQVIFEDQTELCPGGVACECGLEAEQHGAEAGDVVVWFEPLDLLLFVCQTLVQGEGALGEDEVERFESWSFGSDMPLTEPGGRVEDVYEDLGDGKTRLETAVTGMGDVWSTYVEVGKSRGERR